MLEVVQRTQQQVREGRARQGRSHNRSPVCSSDLNSLVASMDQNTSQLAYGKQNRDSVFVSMRRLRAIFNAVRR